MGRAAEPRGRSLAVAGVLIAYAGALDLWQLVPAWAVLLLVAAVLFRRGWLTLFGPMLWYDLVRTGRRVRTYLIRGAYLLILLAVLWMLYLNAWPHAGYRGAPLNSQIARFAESFLYTFLTTQYVLMVLLTPALHGRGHRGRETEKDDPVYPRHRPPQP